MPNDISICPHCGSSALRRITGQDEPTTHYGRLMCGDCGQWLRWLKDPSITLQWQARAIAIDKMLTQHELTNWEQQFLESVREQRTLSPKQRDHLNAIGLRCLGILICALDGLPPPSLPPRSPNSIKSPYKLSRGVSIG